MKISDKRLIKETSFRNLGKLNNYYLSIDGGVIIETSFGYDIIINSSELVSLITMLQQAEEKGRVG